ncbi:hypothetical protein AGR9A_Lc40082 [Agrobacterium salinitolerans str. Hayward 0363]|nr:hypothetical protein AGR9A_Lc40082 [Agrobacterium salinitolerans str. Hayward 0363]
MGRVVCESTKEFVESCALLAIFDANAAISFNAMGAEPRDDFYIQGRFWTVEALLDNTLQGT